MEIQNEQVRAPEWWMVMKASENPLIHELVGNEDRMDKRRSTMDTKALDDPKSRDYPRNTMF